MSKNKNTTIQPKNTTTLAYQGKVVVRVQDNKGRIIRSNTLHNEGGSELFEFICKCLAGEYSSANAKKPTKIIALTFEDLENVPTVSSVRTSLLTANILRDSNPLFISASPMISITNTPGVAKDPSDEHNIYEVPYTTTIHFRLPYSLITTSAIYGFALYGMEQNDTNKWSAVYLCTNTTDDSWAPITEINSAVNFNLLIDWELKLLNTTPIPTTNTSVAENEEASSIGGDE